MNILAEKISNIDKIISKGLNRQIVHNGLAFEYEKNGKNILANKEGDGISFDDRYETSTYHKCFDKDVEKIQERGNRKRLNIHAKCEIFVYSHHCIEDEILAQLCSIREVEVTRVNNSEKSLYSSEGSNHGLDPKKYLFSIQYTLTYPIDVCTGESCA